MTDSNLSNFIIYLIAGSLLAGSIRTVLSRVKTRLSHLILQVVLTHVLNTVGSVAGIMLSLWILAGVFYGDIYLRFLMILLAGNFLLIGLVILAKQSSQQTMKRVILEEMSTKTDPRIGCTVGAVILLAALGGMAALIYVVFFGSYTPDALARFVLALVFIQLVIFNITTLLFRVPLLSSDAVTEEVRMDVLLASFHGLFLVSGGIYLLLAALEISILTDTVSIFGFSINILFFVGVFVLCASILLLLIPYWIGERRRREVLIDLIDNRAECTGELERLVDPTDLSKSREGVRDITERLGEARTKVQDAIDERLEALIHARTVMINSGIEFDDREYENSAKEIVRDKEDHVDKLRHYMERAEYTLDSEDKAVYADLDKMAVDWRKGALEEKEQLRKRGTILVKTASLAAAAWTALNTFFGYSIQDVLKSAGLLP